MRPLAIAHIVVSLMATALSAQDATTLAQREAELTKEAVAGLHAAADALQAQQQHLRALELRREIWQDYDEHDARAREKSGFVQVGSLWRADETRLVLDRDLKADKRKLRRIDRDLNKLQQQLLAEHRELALAWAKLGEADRAARHWRRVLRFAPGDRTAAEALSLREFEGFAGTAMELRMLRRGRAIRGAVDWLNRTEFPIERLTDERLDLLESAGIAHVGVRSEHFTVWGSIDPDQLAVIAQDCERALLLAHSLFGASTGVAFRPKRIRNMVFITDMAQYAAALEVCRGQFDEGRFVFLRDEVDQCFVEHRGEALRLHKTELGLEVARDQAVRGVMQDVTGVTTEGLWEGVGHAACGLLFGRTLTFLVEQQKERTAASWTQKTLAPDLDVWMQIAQESAWAKSDTKSSELVLISAARFTTEQRVKAWAIVHYLLHWRPQYVLELDRSQTKDIRTPPDVEQEFLRRTGYQLPQIDAEWRAFWSRGDELRQAMARDPLPNEKAKDRKAIERGRNLIDAVNQARATFRVGPLGWFVDDNSDFQAVRAYEQALVKAEREQHKRDQQAKQGRKVEPVEMPVAPAAVGSTVLWTRGEDPAAAVAAWLQRPALRDLLLHPGRDLLAVPADLGGCLVGAALPADATVSGEPLAWPRAGQMDVPGEVRVGDLGPRAIAVLAAAGKGIDDVVGMPLSLHFGRVVEPNLLTAVRCEVFERGRPLAGVMVDYGDAVGGGGGAPDGAAGCVAFVPLVPATRGGEVEVRWHVPGMLLGEDRQFGAVGYRVR